jgi:hypothetical protein
VSRRDRQRREETKPQSTRCSGREPLGGINAQAIPAGGRFTTAAPHRIVCTAMTELRELRRALGLGQREFAALLVSSPCRAFAGQWPCRSNRPSPCPETCPRKCWTMSLATVSSRSSRVSRWYWRPSSRSRRFSCSSSRSAASMSAWTSSLRLGFSSRSQASCCRRTTAPCGGPRRTAGSRRWRHTPKTSRVRSSPTISDVPVRATNNAFGRAARRIRRPG